MILIRTQGARGLSQCEQVEKDCWIDARNVSKEDLARLEKEFGIAGELLADIMDIDEQARIEKEDEYTALIIRLPVFDDSFEVSFSPYRWALSFSRIRSSPSASVPATCSTISPVIGSGI